jgi:methionyl-tRNA formyltransferase
MKVVLAAEEAAGVQVLRNLWGLPALVELVAVFTTPPGAASRRALVHEAASALGVPTFPVDAVRTHELAERLRGEQVDLLLNVHSLFVAHPDVVAAPRIGSFNLHPGPLPEYAGLNVPSWAVYRGERRHAVTLHWMDAGVDTGPVAYAQSFELTESDTGLSAAAKCVRQGVPLVSELVQVAAREPSAIPRIEQDRSRRRYFAAGPPNGGRIDWSRPAAELVRLVRAADYGPFPSPWGQVTAEVAGHDVAITKAEALPDGAPATPGAVVDTTESSVTVATGDGLLLVETQPAMPRSPRSQELL